MTVHRVGIVGAGSVARALGAALSDAGYAVVALAGRDPAHAAEAAAYIGSDVQVMSCGEVANVVDRVIVAVSDDAIGEVAEALAPTMRGVVLHTSGASGLAPCQALRSAGVPCGVLHPLQSVLPVARDERPFEGVAFGVVGDGPAVEWASVVVDSLDGYVLSLEEEGLASYHAGAVLASNALVAVLDASLVLLARAGLDRETSQRALGPISRASIENVVRRGPEAALTGPVVRGDVATVATHLHALTRVSPSVADLYRSTARHMLALARRRGLSAKTVESLGHILGDSPPDGKGP